MAITNKSIVGNLQKLKDEIKSTESAISSLQNKISKMQSSGSDSAQSRGWITRYMNDIARTKDALQSLMDTENLYNMRLQAQQNRQTLRTVERSRPAASRFTPEETIQDRMRRARNSAAAPQSERSGFSQEELSSSPPFPTGSRTFSDLAAKRAIADAAARETARQKLLAEAEAARTRVYDTPESSTSTPGPFAAIAARKRAAEEAQEAAKRKAAEETRAVEEAQAAAFSQVSARFRAVEESRIAGGTAGTTQAKLPDATLNTQSEERYAEVVRQIKEALAALKIEGEAADRIIKTLDADLRKLKGAGDVGITATETKNRLRITGLTETLDLPEGTTTDTTKLDTPRSFHKNTGMTDSEHEAWMRRSEGYKDALRENEQFDFQQQAVKDPTLAPAFAQAQQRGFSERNLKTVRQEGEGGIRMLEFSRDDMSRGYKVVEKFNTTITATGDVLPEVGRKFRTFGQGIARDIGELTKWSIAMAVIYGPLQKLSEITSLMIENEVALASATIAVNSTFVDSADIFNAAADAANAAGEEINTTIEAFTAAYRATGGGASESERFSVAQTLLADSMTLAKLAGIDETVAIDTLSAALRQNGRDLDQGSQLLDKWVRTTQIANVDMATLATGFAVMGDTADAAGLSIDQLNGLIATVAETGLASGKEAANATRRVVASFQTPGAVAELQRLGIATEDANGKARSFLEIGQQIFEMRKDNAGAGPLLSDEAFSQLTLIAGQGIRGQAQLSAVLSNFSRIGEISGQSAGAPGGEAAKALEQQLATAQTAMTRFDNSFQKLAQTLGTKGGLLDLFKLITNGATGFVDILDRIVGTLGKATPAVIALTAAMVAYYRKPAETRAMYDVALGRNMANFVGGIAGIDMSKSAIGPRGTLDPEAVRAANLQRFFATNGASRGIGGRVGYGAGIGVGAGILAGAMPVAANLQAGNNKQALYDAGGSIVGGIVGAMVGGGQGAMIGATVGTTMAEVFTTLTKGTIEGYSSFGKPSVIPGVDTGITFEQQAQSRTAEENTKRVEELKTQILADVPGGIGDSRYLDKLDEAESLQKKINDALRKGDKDALVEMLGPEEVYTGAAGLTVKNPKREILSSVFRNAQGQPMTPEDVYGLLPQDATGGKNAIGAGSLKAPSQVDIGALVTTNKVAVDELLAIQGVLTSQGANPDVDPFAEETGAVKSKFGKLMEDLVLAQTTDITQQRIAGKIKTSEFSAQTGAAAGVQTALPTWGAAVGIENLDSKKIKEYTDVLTYGAFEAKTNITNLATEILKLENEVDATTNPDKIKQIKDYKEALNIAIADEALNVKIERAGVKGIVGDVSKPRTSQESDMIMQRTRQLEDQFYSSSEGGGLSQSETTAYLKKTFEETAELVKSGGGTLYKALEPFNPLFRAMAEDLLKAEGKLKEAASVDFQQYKDVDRATLEQLAEQSIQINKSWKASSDPVLAAYGGTTEDQIAIAKDGVAKPLHADFKILAMLLEKIVDQNQKQLDGMFNMPDGANFWVNLAAAQMHMATANASSIKNALAGLITEPATSGKAAELPVQTRPMSIADPRRGRGYSEVNPLQTLTDAELKLRKINDPRRGRGYTEIGPNTPDGRMPSGDRRIGGMTTPALSSSLSAPAVNTTLNLNLNSTSNLTTTVVVDGRTLATVMMPYIKQFFASDMVKATTASGNTTKDYIV